MKHLIYFLIAGLTLSSCKQKSATNKDNITQPITINSESTDANKTDQKPKLETPSKVKDSIPTHIFKTGETLWDLSRTYYGNRHYSSILTKYNDIKNVNTIKNGTAIKIPSLKNLLNDQKLGLAQIQDEVDKILRARKLFMKHETSLGDLREEVKGRTPLKLPAVVNKDLQMATTLINESIDSLNKIESDSIKKPVKMIWQLKPLSTNLRDLSKGHHDGPYKYDLDMVHQKLIQALLRGITWAENHQTNQ